MLVGYKQRDILEKSKRSVFYCLFVKILYAVTQVPEQKAMRILSLTLTDFKKNFELEDLPEAMKTPEVCCRILLIQKIVKVFQSALMLIVNLPQSARQATLSKVQDEQAYSLMIEDFCKFAMKKKQIYLMKVVPNLMHGGFISFKTYEAMSKSF